MLNLARLFARKKKQVPAESPGQKAETAKQAEPETLQRERLEKTSPFKTIGRLAEAVNRSYSDRIAADIDEEAGLRDALSQIAVIAFVGPSGTGKSTRAISVSRKHGIEFLIDDGLLIRGNQIVAGSSAKKAASRLESVRQALFADETRAAVMRRALAVNQPTTLMVLGTSDGMLEKICRNLWLNQPAMLIRIEDVSSDEEMRQAKQTRMAEGKHTIPVPSMEIKHEFSGNFIDPISRLWKRRDRERGIAPVQPDSERTVVRPTFSALGGYSISDEAMGMMTAIIVGGIKGVAELIGFTAENEVYGVVIQLDLALYYGFSAQSVLHDVQQKVSTQLEEYTSINVIAVNVKARRVVHAAVAGK